MLLYRLKSFALRERSFFRAIRALTLPQGIGQNLRPMETEPSQSPNYEPQDLSSNPPDLSAQRSVIPDIGLDLSFQELGGENHRSKTALRLKYEAEVKVIRSQIGSIESVRKELGLSQRKMCQLLMVDPSTWTRWIKDEQKVPPHVYRALQWYLQLIEKRPEWHPQNSFQPIVRGLIPGLANKEMEGLKEEIAEQVKKLRSHSTEFTDQFRVLTEKWNLEKSDLLDKIEKKDMALTIWKMFVLINTIALGIWLFKSVFS